MAILPAPQPYPTPTNGALVGFTDWTFTEVQALAQKNIQALAPVSSNYVSGTDADGNNIISSGFAVYAADAYGRTVIVANFTTKEEQVTWIQDNAVAFLGTPPATA